MKQTQETKKAAKRESEEPQRLSTHDASSKAKLEAEIKAGLDEILDEIEAALEENTTAMGITAETFVNRFIQANGE